jgi:circadian clock protein KaiB
MKRQPGYGAMQGAPGNKQGQGVPASHGKYVLWLFVAGDRPNSLQARQNIAQICEVHLQGRCELTVVDVSQDFKTALAHDILLTPTLLLLSPPPRVTIIGNLSDTQTVLAALRLAGGKP